MVSHVLGIGYTQSTASIAKISIWKQLGLELDCTEDFDHAACMLSNRNIAERHNGCVKKKKQPKIFRFQAVFSAGGGGRTHTCY